MSTDNVSICDGQTPNPAQFSLFAASLGISVVGVVGNGVTVAIFSQPSHRSSINVLICGLALADVAFQLTGIFTTLPFGLYYHSGDLCAYLAWQAFATLYLYPLNKMAQTASVWTHMSIAFERFLAVVYPFRAARVCTVRFSIATLTVVAGLAFAFNLSRFWEHDWHDMLDPPDNTTLYFAGSHLAADPLYQHVYTLWLDLLLMYVVPFATLSALNASIAFTLTAAQKNRHKYAPAAASTTMDTLRAQISESTGGLRRGVSKSLRFPRREGPRQISGSFRGQPPLRRMYERGQAESERVLMAPFPHIEPPICQKEDLRVGRPLALQGRASSSAAVPESRSQGRTTQMMLIIVIFFLLFYSASFLLAILEVTAVSVTLEQWYAVLMDVSNLLVLTASAINPLVFFRYSTAYRRELTRRLPSFLSSQLHKLSFRSRVRKRVTTFLRREAVPRTADDDSPDQDSVMLP